jgi:hypothetical protein
MSTGDQRVERQMIVAPRDVARLRVILQRFDAGDAAEMDEARWQALLTVQSLLMSHDAERRADRP